MSEAYWKKPLAWNRKAEQAGERHKAFCASLADVFEDHPQVGAWRDDLWCLVEQTPNLDWLLLTKRPENIFRFTPERWVLGKLPRNIWYGVSAEDQETFETRWSALDGETHYLYPEVLFLSLEPLLGPIDMELGLSEIDIGDEESPYWARSVDWVIVGGESGPNARPCSPDWVRSLRDQAQAAGVAFFFKQWGAWLPEGQGDESLRPFHKHGLEILMEQNRVCTLDGKQFHWRVGKKAAGRILDGRTWDEVPEARR